jgi:hypothetical protein
MISENFGRRIHKPIILLGSGRSGTSLLGRIFSRHPEVAYLPEPRPIWMYGNSYRNDHYLTEKDLKPRIARYIDHRFAEFLEKSGRMRFAEKTPSNCLRIRFIHALYPDCKIIHIYRDGRDVVRSMLKIQEKKPRKGILRDRMATTPIWEWPSYFPMLMRTYWRTNVRGKSATYWGAQPPGWREWADLPAHMVVAHQWRALVETAIEDGRKLPQQSYFEMRYERLIREPHRCIDEMCNFAEIAPSQEMSNLADERIDPNRPAKWRATLSPEQEDDIVKLLEPTLCKLGYQS